MLTFKTSFLMLWAAASLAAAKPAYIKHPRSGGASDQLQITLGLATGNPGALVDKLLEVSDPRGSSYGHYLSRAAVDALLQPNPSDVEAVLKILAKHNISSSSIHVDGTFIDVTLTPQQSQDLLGAPDAQNVTVASLPQDLQGTVIHVFQLLGGNLIAPSVKKPLHSPHKALKYNDLSALKKGADGGPFNCSQTLAPECVQDLYRMNAVNVQPGDEQIFGITGMDGTIPQFADLESRTQMFQPGRVGANFSIVLLNGGLDTQSSSDDDGDNVEGNIEVQTAVSLTENIPVHFFSTGGRDRDLISDLDFAMNVTKFEDIVSIEPYLLYTRLILALSDAELPTELSISYFVWEQNLTPRYMEQTCLAFAALALRGTTVLADSGELGVGTSCERPSGESAYTPAFPASCPYLTAVGGTKYSAPEIALAFSGGGFSSVFPAPAYQRDAVGAYLPKVDPNFRGFYNASGRGFPDVSALGGPFPVTDAGETFLVGSIGSATNTWAAVVALLNAHRQQQGKPSLGFMNPLLYSTGVQGLTDITRGASEGCFGQSVVGLPSTPIPGAGFNATEGWDPVTGLGTPRVDKLIDII